MSLIANFKCVSDEEIESIPEYPGTLETFLRDKNEAPRDINISERTGKKRKDPVTWLIGFFIMLFCITLLIYPPKVPESTQDKITSVAVYGGLIFLFVGALIVILYKKKNEGDCCVYVPPVPGTKSQIPEDTMDIDKAWHGIHYLLCGSEKNGHGPSISSWR